MPEVPRHEVLYAVDCRQGDVKSIVRVTRGHRMTLNEGLGQCFRLKRNRQQWDARNAGQAILYGVLIPVRAFVTNELRNKQVEPTCG